MVIKFVKKVHVGWVEVEQIFIIQVLAIERIRIFLQHYSFERGHRIIDIGFVKIVGAVLQRESTAYCIADAVVFRRGEVADDIGRVVIDGAFKKSFKPIDLQIDIFGKGGVIVADLQETSIRHGVKQVEKFWIHVDSEVVGSARLDIKFGAGVRITN